MAINLKSLSKNTVKVPRICIYGDPKVGKTTFAASAPNVVFIQTENGLGNLDVTAFPLATSFQDVMDAMTALYQEEHNYTTLAVDSLDWLETLIWQKVCIDHKVPSIESLGYGRGYVEALHVWRMFLDGITALRDDRNMTIIMIAHSEIKRMEAPELPAYDMRTLKLHKRASALVEEFSDVILYAAVQTNTITEDAGFNAKRVRAVSTGNRIIHTVGQPAFLAGNRYSLPTPLPLSWDAFAEAMYGPSGVLKAA